MEVYRRLLLLLLPPGFRRRHGRQVLDLWREIVQEQGGESVALWLKMHWDFLSTVHRAWGHSLRAVLGRRSRRVGRYGRLGHRVYGKTTWRWEMNDAIKGMGLILRSLAKARTFSALVVVTVAIGVASTTAVMSLARGVLLVPLPFEHAQRLATVWLADESFEQSPLTVPDYRYLENAATSFDAVAARWGTQSNLVLDEQAQPIEMGMVTTGWFDVVGLGLEMGRYPSPGERASVVLSHGLWTTAFGSDPDVLGRTIDVGRESLTVVGILSESNSDLPTVGGRRERYDVIRALPDEWLQGEDWVLAWLRVVGRLAPGATIEDARTELASISQQISRQVPSRAEGFEFRTAGLQDEMVAGVRPTLVLLLWAVAFVLLIMISNVANLFLVRGEVRRTELAVRAALGSGSARLVQLFTAEAVVLAVAGGALGAWIAWTVVEAVTAGLLSELPGVAAVEVDAVMMMVSIGVSLLCALLFGFLPAVRASRRAPALALLGRGLSGSRRQRSLGNLLVTGQVAAALALLAGTGMILRSTAALTQAWTGFEAEGQIVASVVPSGTVGLEELVPYLQTLEAELEALPGVRAVGFTDRMPLMGGVMGGPYATESNFDDPGPRSEADFRRVSPRFLDAMGGRLLSGRFFEESDPVDVAIVDDEFARRAWPGEEVVGQRIWTGALGRNGEWSRVVGVIDHMRHENVMQDGDGVVYFPLAPLAAEQGLGEIWLSVRSDGSLETLAPEIRRTVLEADPLGVVADLMTMRQAVGRSLSSHTLALRVFFAFGVIALVLAGVGLYGIISYQVRIRRHEMGIRLALGAEGSDLLAGVLRQSGTVVGRGIALGLLGVVLPATALPRMLYGVQSVDVLAVGASIGVLVVTGTMAGLLPARRATRVDPVESLRIG